MSAVLGALAGVGVLTVVHGVRRPRLASVLDRYVSDGAASASSTPMQIAAVVFRASSEDLAVTDTSLERHLFERLVSGSVLGILPLASSLVMALGGVLVPPALVAVFCIAGLVVGSWFPGFSLVRRARRARRDIRSALSGYLDLVSIMLAGGAGIETALHAAAHIGSGPTFTLVSDALALARSSRRSPWDVLAETGRRLGVVELPELAATVRLGGEQGARMTSSLVAKAESLRSSQMAELEAAANASTERMGLPMVLMFVSFLVLLGYPAVHLISRGF